MKKSKLSYVIGEILIVIIGISIAFSMNKCAENSKNKTQRAQYLISLKNDVEADKAQLENNLIVIKDKIKLANEIIPLLTKKDSKKRRAIPKIFAIAVITNFNAKDITYQTLINSGDLKLIEDFELKTAIESHYSNYKIMQKAYERQEIIHKEYLGNYFIHNADYDEMSKGKFGFKDKKLLKNIIQSIGGSLKIKQKATQQAIESCDSLIDILKKSLSE